MTRDEVDALIVMLRGFWPHSAPELGDPIVEDALFLHLHELNAGAVADAVLAISREGEQFCPAPGVIYHRATLKPPIVPPERVDYVEEIPRSTAKEIPLGSQVDGDGWVDLEGFHYDADGNLDVPRLVADMKLKLKGKPGARFLGAALRAIPQP